MRYILRVVVHESRWEEQLQDVISLCKYAGIEEVFVKEQCHQISMSPLSLEKHGRMSEIYKQFSKALKSNGITFSINIATIIGHCDAELKSEETLPFTHFVGASLKSNKSTYCILDEQWQSYGEKMLALYAQSAPDKIMIDDDFRSINHSEYLGCFCPLHIKATEKLCNKELTAQSLLEHVLGNTEENKRVRGAWMEANFAGQLKAARKMRKAIEAVNPLIRVGLMNSGEANHSVQGRDIAKLIEAFAGSKRGISRPLGGAYADCLHEELVSAVQGMSLSMAQLTNVEIISEVENWPHTCYTKSILETALQMKLHVLAGADAVSMNIFDFMGTPYAQEPELMEMIKNTRAELNAIAFARSGKAARGVGMLWHKDAAKNKDNHSHSVQDAVPSRIADSLFAMLGIPTCFTESSVNFLQGDVARCMEENAILRLLSKGVVLDDEAVRVLSQRGYAKEIGCTVQGCISEPSAERLISEAFCGPFCGNLVPTNLLRLHLGGYDMPRLLVHENAHVITRIVDQNNDEIANGITLYENHLGGRVCVIPTKLSVWTFAYRSRAFLLRKIVEWLGAKPMPISLGKGLNVAPFYYEDSASGEGLLALLNTGLDPQKVTVDTGLEVMDGKGTAITLQDIILPPLTLRWYQTRMKQEVCTGG